MTLGVVDAYNFHVGCMVSYRMRPDGSLREESIRDRLQQALVNALRRMKAWPPARFLRVKSVDVANGVVTMENVQHSEADALVDPVGEVGTGRG